MRSRYSAFAVGDEAYLLRTWHPRTRPERMRLDPRHRWTGLEVRAVEAGAAGDDEGTVTYRASSVSADGRPASFVETASFGRRGGRWVYVDGAVEDG